MNTNAIEVNQVGKSFSSSQAGGYVFRTDGISRLKERVASRFRSNLSGEVKDNKTWVLKNVNFEVKKGEFFGIVGNNGAGKTTLLRIISGILRASTGNVIVNGRMSALLAMGTGFNGELTGRQNIFLNSAMQGVMPKIVADLESEIIEFAELEDSIDMPLKYYSSGMRARLGFSIASHILPDVIIIDEALSAGDTGFKQKSSNHLTKMKQEGRTLLLVTHSLGIVKNMCERAMWLSEGEVLMVGEAREVVGEYEKQVQPR